MNMAEVSSYLGLLDPHSDPESGDDNHRVQTLDSLYYCPGISDQLDHIFSDSPFDQNDLFSPRRSAVLIGTLEEDDDDVSFIDSIANAVDPHGPEGQVSFVMDLFQQRVEQSQVMGGDRLIREAQNDSTFRVIEGNCDDGIIDGLELDLGLGLELGLGVENDCLDADENENENCGYMVENCVASCGAASTVAAAGADDEDGFFVRRRTPRSESGGAQSIGGAERVRLSGLSDDSDEDENDLIFGADLHSENDDYFGELDRALENNDDDASVSVPLCWDSFQLEDHRESNDDFEWEEVDGRVDEREFLSMFLDTEDERPASGAVSTMMGPEDDASAGRVGEMETLGWEVLLHARNLETNQGLYDDAEPYFGDQQDYIHNADTEYEMLFGQFADYDVTGRPPASKSVVQNLPLVIVTQEDVDKNAAVCAVCKDDINVGEQGKLLPCAHRYHGDCIVPWLGIRNTCPVCRYELPTDDADYERRKARRASHSA